MRTPPSELTIRRLLELTKAALYGTVPDEELFTGAGEADWNELFELSTVQGVMALSLESVLQLPKELQPPLNLKLRWIASVEAVKKRYLHQLEIAKELSALFRENNIRMMMIKGFSLSRLYPIPSSREFGDLDIFLCGKAEEGDAILEQITNRKKFASKKHIGFSYEGILIENHHTLLNHDYYKCFYNSEVLEKQLLNIIIAAGIMEEKTFDSSNSSNETLVFPPPEFELLFVTLHMLAHLPSGIVLRYLCDLTVLFKAYSGKTDFLQYKSALSESKLTKVTDAFISLMVRYLGLNPGDAPPYESDLTLEDRLWNDLLYPKVLPLPKEKRTWLNVIIHKIRLTQAHHWKYELVFPGKFWKKIFYSTFFHFSHPKTIKKFTTVR